MLVEDDPVTIFITEKLLEKYYTVTSVKNGYDALSYIESQKFDVILMDINLGDLNMDGIKTMRMIRKNPKTRNIKIIAITSFSTNRTWYIQQGFDDLLLKPLEEDTVIETIEKSFSKGHYGKFVGVFSMN